jgi:hypothetical protein
MIVTTEIWYKNHRTIQTLLLDRNTPLRVMKDYRENTMH